METLRSNFSFNIRHYQRVQDGAGNSIKKGWGVWAVSKLGCLLCVLPSLGSTKQITNSSSMPSPHLEFSGQICNNVLLFYLASSGKLSGKWFLTLTLRSKLIQRNIEVFWRAGHSRNSNGQTNILIYYNTFS